MFLRRFLILASVVSLMVCTAMRAQEPSQQPLGQGPGQVNDRRKQSRDAATPARSVDPPDLARENLQRVAASRTSSGQFS